MQEMPACALELLGQELAQRTVAERPAFEPVGRERRALALEHGGGGRDQAIDRKVLGIVVAADEVVSGKARPLAAGAGRPAVNRGAKSNDPEAMDVVSCRRVRAR